MKNKNAFSKFIYSQKASPYVFVLPFILSFCIFWIYPLSSTIMMSFQDIKPAGTEWIGLGNYAKLMKDKVFIQAVGNSVLYMVLTLVLLIPFPMAYAVLMDSNFVKAKGIWKAVLYIPALTSVVISGTLFRLMFSEQPTALANQILTAFGGEPIKWLKMYPTSYFALLMIACWRWTGVNMLYFVAGLKNIDKGLYESADIDGANSWQKFWYVTVPLLKPTIIYVLTISVYAGLSMFLESFMLWAGNGSPNNIGLTIVGYLYRRGIEKNQMGYASAIGLVASFRPGVELIRKGLAINLDVSTMTLDNYIYLFGGNGGAQDSAKYFMWFRNSLFLTLVTVVGTLVVCYFVAYGLSMYDFKLQGILFFLVIATMMVPFEILMLPLYQEIIKLNLINTTWGVILPGLCGASTIFFFRQYMQGLPKELLDAGRIDGASEYGICLKIMLPITKPAFASMAILTSMGAWNNLLWPMLVYRDASKFTLPIGLNTLLTPYGNNYDVLIAGSMFSIIPVLIVFLMFQSYFVDGMTAGAVKG